MESHKNRKSIKTMQKNLKPMNFILSIQDFIH